MPSIAEATRADGTPTGQRFVVGVGLVAAGALLVGLGAAGFSTGVSVQAGLLMGGTLVLSSLTAIAVRASLRDRERDLVGVGVVLGVASLLLLWGLPPEGAITALTVLGAVGYLASVTVVVAAVMARVTMRRSHGNRVSRADSTGWTSSAAHGPSRETVADGGGREDDLTFLNDEE